MGAGFHVLIAQIRGEALDGTAMKERITHSIVVAISYILFNLVCGFGLAACESSERAPIPARLSILLSMDLFAAKITWSKSAISNFEFLQMFLSWSDRMGPFRKVMHLISNLGSC